MASAGFRQAGALSYVNLDKRKLKKKCTVTKNTKILKYLVYIKSWFILNLSGSYCLRSTSLHFEGIALKMTVGSTYEPMEMSSTTKSFRSSPQSFHSNARNR
jgi:hypothetical protein